MISHEKILEMRNNSSVSKHNKDYWSKETDRDLSTMYYEGYGISEMALEMGRTENSIGKRIKDLKLDAKRYSTRKKQKTPDCLCSNCNRLHMNLCNGPSNKADCDTGQ